MRALKLKVVGMKFPFLYFGKRNKEFKILKQKRRDLQIKLPAAEQNGKLSQKFAFETFKRKVFCLSRLGKRFKVKRPRSETSADRAFELELD